MWRMQAAQALAVGKYQPGNQAHHEVFVHYRRYGHGRYVPAGSPQGCAACCCRLWISKVEASLW